MAKFTFNDSDNKAPIEEPGDYTFEVVGYEFGTAQSNNEILTLKIQTPSGAQTYDNLVFTEKAWWKIDTFLKSVLPSKGVKPPKKGTEVDINDAFVKKYILNATGKCEICQAEVKDKPGKFRNEVVSYFTPDHILRVRKEKATGAGSAVAPKKPTGEPAASLEAASEPGPF